MAYVFRLFAGSISAGGLSAIDGLTTAATISAIPGSIVDKTCVQGNDGTVYFIDCYCVRKISPLGYVTTIAGSFNTPGYVDAQGLTARFTLPMGIAVDNANNLYITERANNTIRKIDTSGNVTTWLGVNGAAGTTEGTGAAARFIGPTYLCYDGNDTLFVIDHFRVRIIKISTNSILALAGSITGFSGVTDGTGTAARFNIAGGNASAMWWAANRNILIVMNPNNAVTLFQVREVTLGGVVTTPTMNGAVAFSGGLFGNSQSVGLNTFIIANGTASIFNTIVYNGASYDVTNESVWTDHVSGGAIIRSNPVAFGNVTGVFGRESSTAGSNTPVFYLDIPLNTIVPVGGLNIAGTAIMNFSTLPPGLGKLTVDSTRDGTSDKIPNPFFKTGYIGG